MTDGRLNAERLRDAMRKAIEDAELAAREKPGSFGRSAPEGLCVVAFPGGIEARVPGKKTEDICKLIASSMGGKAHFTPDVS